MGDRIMIPLWSVKDGNLCWAGADQWSAKGLHLALNNGENDDRPTVYQAQALIDVVGMAMALEQVAWRHGGMFYTLDFYTPEQVAEHGLEPVYVVRRSVEEVHG